MSENQTLFERQLEKLLARFEELEHLLAGESGSEAYVERAREYTSLQEAVTSIRLWKEALKRQEEAEFLLEDPEFTRLAKSELEEVKALLPDLFHRVQVSLIPRDEADLGNAILEIRPAAGGEEAGLFAAQLFDAYRRFSEKNGWRFVQLSASLNDLGGLREGIAEIGGSGVFSRLKYESGVHRVQRVPATETQGRIHTSTVTVAVLPEAGEVDVDLRDEDLRIDVYRASGAGGQHVNKTESAVRVTHLPSGLVVAIQDEKSQHKNKAKALQVLRSRLYDLQRQRAHDARAADRKSQLGTGDRSERIRTYNFPQGRVTDHRINLTLYKIAQIMNGELDEIVDELVRQDQLDQLAGQMGSG